jgi:hypothetical protein
MPFIAAKDCTQLSWREGQGTPMLYLNSPPSTAEPSEGRLRRPRTPLHRLRTARAEPFQSAGLWI